MHRRIIIPAIRLSLLFALALWSLGHDAQRQNTLSAAPISSAEALPNLQGEAAIAHLKQHGIYQTIRRQLEAEHYRIRPLPAGSAPVGQAAYQADNHAQQLRADFAPDGLRLSPRQPSQGEWQSRMKLIGYGYGAQLLPASAARLTAAGNRIEIHHQFPTPDSQPPIVEWYVNTAAGLEHGFELPAPPGVKTGQEPLRVALALEGELRAEAVEGGQALDFKDDAGQRLLRYDHLVVKDGGGRELEARMAVRMEGGEGEVWLEVDDRDAVWPVTIDPTFTQQQKLEASDAGESDGFGGSVAISGETVVVGAPDDTGAAGIQQGSAYVFVRSGGVWSQQRKLEASDAARGDFFGGSVAISGETIVVSAPSDDGAAGGGQGSAYVFVRSGGVWSQQQKLEPSDAATGDFFGSSVAISGDTVVVGAPYDDGAAGDDQGSAYVFVRSGGVWSQQRKLEASDAAAGDGLGWSVAISGETIVLGAPGYSSAFGGVKGSAYVFVRSGGVWSQQQKLLASDAAVGDRFGGSVAISGETVVVGAPEDKDAAGEAAAGSAYVFVRSGGVWSQQRKLEDPALGGGDQYFGASVAISGETVVVGKPRDHGPAGGGQGSAIVFVRSGGVWSQQQKLLASDAVAGDQLGSVAISGETVVVGAPSDDGAAGVDQGSAYVFGPTLQFLKAQITSPPPESTLASSTATFVWSTGTGVSEYWLEVGTSPGGAQIYSQSRGTNLSAAISGLPTNSSPVYVRLWSRINSGWYYNDYTYTSAGSVSVKAQITSPPPGSTLASSTATFGWNTGTGVSEYWLEVGTSPGGAQIYSQSRGTNLSAAISGLPTNSSPVYVRLWSRINSGWYYNDYTYTSAGSVSVKAQITSPPPGSTLASSTATFGWNTGTGVSEYWLEVGTSPGGAQIYSQSRGTNLSVAVSGLPTNSSPVYVRLWSLIDSGWYYNDYTYTSAGGVKPQAQITSPPPESILTSPTVTFIWSTGSGVSQYWLSIGTTPGGSQIYDQSQGTNLSVSVSGLPTNGSTLYVRLWSLIAGVWQWNDYTYRSGGPSAQITSPPPGSRLTSATVNFMWSTGSQVSEYWLSIGTTLGGSQIYDQSRGMNLSVTVSGLPTNGSTVYVRLWSLINTGWYYNDYTYLATTP